MSNPVSIREALGGIIDYAGLFPPAALEIPQAVQEYAQLRRKVQGRWLAERFVLPLWPQPKWESSLLAAFKASDRQDGEIFQAALLLPGVKEPADVPATVGLLETFAMQKPSLHLTESGLVASSLEFAVADGFEDETAPAWDDLRVALGRMASTDTPLPVYLEFDWRTWSEERAEAIRGLREIHPGLGIKIRTGGLTPDMIPPPSLLSRQVGSLVSRWIPFKCTAGLHASLYEVSPRFGFEMHGFMNVLALTWGFMKGGSEEALEEILVQSSPSGLMGSLEKLVGPCSFADLAVARRFFHSFGSCSVDEPLESLAAHGFLQCS